ncbi:MAG TPA: DinB family protein, partial [Thermoanaerobaculia bacterium]|nr:DinB family protein [Thermoanaerobaculia bacterium]
MKISETLLPEFDHEYANTRRTLERVPNDKLSWQPHAKSWPFQKLATHLAHLPTWVTETFRSDHVDLAAPGEAPKPATTEEILALFDKSVAEARVALAGAGDEEFFKQWSLRNGEQVIFTMPKIAVLRGFVFNHQIHHRGQLTIYLRLNDIPVPALYGPSAD